MSEIFDEILLDNINIKDIKKDEDVLKILIADNDSIFLEKIKNKIRFWFKEFIKIYYTYDREKIIEMIDSNRIDFLITEVEWDKDPADFIEDIMNHPFISETPMIVVSSYYEPMFENFLYKMGVLEFFYKNNIDYFKLENKLRNLFRLQFHNKILYQHIDDSIRKMQITKGISEDQIQELKEMVRLMKEELEKEYQNKIRLEEEKKKIQNIFGLYVDSSIINGVISGEIPLELKGTEKEISVLFADIRGYTSIAEKLTPKEVVSFLNEYFTAMTEVLLGYNAMIDKYIGDSIMAIFGAPIDNPNHRDNALEAAVEMQNIFELWNQNWHKNYNINAKMGIGVASGIATLGNIGSFQKLSYTAVGDTVNIASRLESIAKPGEILINENLLLKVNEEVKNKFQYEEIPSLILKGKSQEIKAYKIIY